MTLNNAQINALAVLAQDDEQVELVEGWSGPLVYSSRGSFILEENGEARRV